MGYIRLRNTLLFSILVSGATSIVSQIIFLREFLIVFYGNEISIGIILAGWLLWGSLGSIILGKVSDRAKDPVLFFLICQVCLFFILPLTLVLIRSYRAFIGISSGEIIGYPQMIIASFSVLMLPCAIMGFLFTLACRIYNDKITPDVPDKVISDVYVIEAAGALFGGFAVSYLLIPLLTPSFIVCIFSGLNIMSSFFLTSLVGKKKTEKVTRALVILIMSAGIIFFLSGGVNRIGSFSNDLLWKGFGLLDTRDSIYGNVTVTERGLQKSFYENGLYLYTVPDKLYSEGISHFAMLESPDPVDVLLIGGGVGGILEEILKYPVKSIDYVELDPTIIKMAREHLGREEVSYLKRKEVRILNTDGCFYVKNAVKKYDCVIISLSDPYTAQINRFYTIDFFRELNRIMRKNAVLAFPLTSSENYISYELRDYLKSIYGTLSAVFPDVVIIPGDTMYFLASTTPEILTDNPDTIMKRLKSRGIETEYMREYYIFSKLSADRVEYAEKTLKEGPQMPVNMNFRPISYYLATIFWGTHFGGGKLNDLLRSITGEKIWMACVFFCLLILIFSLRKEHDLKSAYRYRKRKILLSITTTGFSEIIFQVAVMLSFQIIYGYVFYKIGIIITSFMAGLAIGGWIVRKKYTATGNILKTYSLIQASVCLYPLILPLFFLWLSRTGNSVISWLGSNIILPFIPLTAGIIGGIQFTLAGLICLKKDPVRSTAGKHVGSISGLNYGVDLIGACIGAIIGATVLIPVIGILETCLLAAVINTVVLAILLIK